MKDVATFRTCSLLFTKKTSTLSTLEIRAKNGTSFPMNFSAIVLRIFFIDISLLRRVFLFVGKRALCRQKEVKQTK